METLKGIHDMIGFAPEDAACRALWWNLRGTYWYFESNTQYLVNYGRRYRLGMPISSSIAESAVNEVVSLRCAKKRQMRWTNKKPHLLVQVRVAVLNGELKMRDMPDRRRTLIEKSVTIIGNVLRSGASAFDCSPLRQSLRTAASSITCIAISTKAFSRMEGVGCSQAR